MVDNPLIFLMLAVNNSNFIMIEIFVCFSGGVKEEQVLDAFKILFSDNQVNLFFFKSYFSK
jgi:hypothetical protein